MKRKMALIILLCFSLTLVFAGCASKPDPAAPTPTETDTSWQDIQDKGFFVMGLDDEFPPMGFRDEKNEFVGFDIDMAKEAAQRLGVEVEFQSIVWETKMAELNGGNIDLIWNGLTITEERQKQMAFTAPYIEDRQIIVVNADSTIAGKADLKDKKIGIQAASSAIEAVEADVATYEVIKENLLEFESNNLALRDLKGGGLDAVIVDEVVGRYYLAKHPGEYTVLEDNFGVEAFGVGLRKGDQAFLTELQRVLDEMKADGTSQKISEQWFGENLIK